ncbi:MAG: hypothetical protein HQL46_00635 [Gammaproteobacteria bacterium]|nr:hypothetical protein [Gammaproteobacteria bacterium]
MSRQQNTKRANHLMKVLIVKHIHNGLPIGSKFLQQSSGLNLSLKHIEFVTLSSHRLLVVMVTSDDEIHNKVIETSTAIIISTYKKKRISLKNSWPFKCFINIA